MDFRWGGAQHESGSASFGITQLGHSFLSAPLSAIMSSRNDLAQGNERRVPHPNHLACTPIQTAIIKAGQTVLWLIPCQPSLRHYDD